MADHLALNPGERISTEIRRIAHDLTDRGLEHICSFETDPDTAVHETRKRLKELRALLRLVRDEIGERGYRIENRHLRDVGRLLSSGRDSAVLVETLSGLREHTDARQITDDLDALRAKLIEVYGKEIARLRAQNIPEQIAESFHALSRRIMTWPIRREGFGVMESGLERAYRNSVKAMERGRKKPTDAHLHEWRKQTKHLWYQVRMLAPAWSAVLDGLAETLHDLSDSLGTDHDLAVLAATCRNLHTSDSSPPLLPTLIRRRREEARRNVWLIGTRPFAEEPEAFVKRIEVYWNAAVRER